MIHPDQINILLVEDNQADAHLVNVMLSEDVNCSFNFNHVESLSAALTELNSQQYDVLLLDLSLPDSMGLESIQNLLVDNPNLPIVVLTGLNDEKMAIDAMQYGAQDYLVKDQGGAALLSRSIRYAIERKRSEQRLLYLAQYDSLTGLPNRVLFLDRLKQAIKHASRINTKGALMFLDLDYFKDVNDTLGHLAGDQLLIELASRLKSCVRKEDTVSRFGGDEFTIILNEIADKKSASLVAQKIKNTLKNPITIDGQEIFMSTSIGIVLFEDENDIPESLIKHADMALYAAKDNGRSTHIYYESKINDRITKRINMINDLRFALDRNEFELHYQPQIELSSGELIGMEALIRWQHPTLGLLEPSKFVHLLEETGLIIPVGEWVFEAACKQNYLWQKENIAKIRIAVNLSSRQFHQKKLVKRITQCIKDSRLLPQYLQIEITESTLMTNSQDSIKILHELRNLGIQLSIDDFGTGFSSLSYLRLFPFQALKIDRSFVKEIATQSNGEKIITAVITLAHSLDMQVVAEGVELEKQLPYLMKNGCDEVQGYLFSKAMSANNSTEWLKNIKKNNTNFLTISTSKHKSKIKNQKSKIKNY